MQDLNHKINTGEYRVAAEYLTTVTDRKPRKTMYTAWPEEQQHREEKLRQNLTSYYTVGNKCWNK